VPAPDVSDLHAVKLPAESRDGLGCRWYQVCNSPGESNCLEEPMASVTVRDVLKQIEGIHLRLSTLYGALAECSTHPRAQMLAKYMATREERLVAALAHYLKDRGNQSTLDYWFKSAPIMPDELCLDGLSLSPDMTTDELSNFAVGLDEALAGYVEHLAGSAATVGVGELFADLLAQEQREQRQTSRATLEVEREM
jgi:hypothetical protein